MKKQQIYDLGLIPIEISGPKNSTAEENDRLDDIRNNIDNQLGFDDWQIDNVKEFGLDHFKVKLHYQDTREVKVFVFMKEKNHDMIYINSTTFFSEDDILEQSSCIEQYVANKIQTYVLDIACIWQDENDYYEKTIH